MSDLTLSELGKKSDYIAEYDPTLLFPIPRETKRLEIGIDPNKLPFKGVDIWHHYEVSWLNKKGKPMVAMAIISYPCESPNIIESKSMKLYFNSFNNTQLPDIKTLEKTISKDLSNGTQSDVNVSLTLLQDCEPTLQTQFDGISLDTLDIQTDCYTVNPDYLKTHDNIVSEVLHSDLLKSNCLVTGQPDWGSLQIQYEGNQLDQTGLLKYIISFRNHNEFHEQCIERIFHDIMQRCKPSSLTVYGRYTRRGGLDINPIRTTQNALPMHQRLIRQ